MIELKILLDEVDYRSLSEVLIPALAESMAKDGGVLGGMLSQNKELAASMARTVLDKMPQEKKDELLVQLPNRNRDKLLEKGLRQHATKVVETHKNAGHQLILATASFDLYAELIGHKLGFHDSICTKAAWNAANRLSGALRTPNCYGSAKRQRVDSYMVQNHDNPYIIVYSDSHADLPLFEVADEPVCVNPTRKLRRIAAKRMYKIQDWNKSCANRPA